MGTRELLLDRLGYELAPGRLAHVRRVAALAVELARRFGADPVGAELAGLGHDRCRQWAPERLLAEARLRAIPLTADDERDPLPRLHGLLAGPVLDEEVGLSDPEVHLAMASHTLGRPGMSVLERVVFVADYAEPGRAPHEGLEAVRAALSQDLNEACRLAADATLQHLIATGKPVHPQGLSARNWLLTQPPFPALAPI